MLPPFFSLCFLFSVFLIIQGSKHSRDGVGRKVSRCVCTSGCVRLYRFLSALVHSYILLNCLQQNSIEKIWCVVYNMVQHYGKSQSTDKLIISLYLVWSHKQKSNSKSFSSFVQLNKTMNFVFLEKINE